MLWQKTLKLAPLKSKYASFSSFTSSKKKRKLRKKKCIMALLMSFWKLVILTKLILMNGDNWNISLESSSCRAIADVLLKPELIKSKPLKKSSQISDIEAIPYSWMVTVCWRRLSGSVGQSTFLLKNNGLCNGPENTRSLWRETLTTAPLLAVNLLCSITLHSASLSPYHRAHFSLDVNLHADTIFTSVRNAHRHPYRCQREMRWKVW